MAVCSGPFEALYKFNQMDKESRRKGEIYLANENYKMKIDCDKHIRFHVYDVFDRLQYGSVINNKTQWEQKYTFVLHEFFRDLKEESLKGDFDEYFFLCIEK